MQKIDRINILWPLIRGDELVLLSGVSDFSAARTTGKFSRQASLADIRISTQNYISVPYVIHRLITYALSRWNMIFLALNTSKPRHGVVPRELTAAFRVCRNVPERRQGDIFCIKNVVQRYKNYHIDRKYSSPCLFIVITTTAQFVTAEMFNSMFMLIVFGFTVPDRSGLFRILIPLHFCGNN